MAIEFKVRFSDNAKELKAHLAEGLQQIEVTKAGMDRLVKTIGGENIIRAAHNYAAALKQIGGEAGALAAAERLTSQERQRGIALLEKAIQKYELLGKTAPAALRDLLAGTKAFAAAAGQIEKPMQGAGKAVGAFRSNISGLATSVGIGFGVGAVVNFGKALLNDADHLTKLSDKTGVSVQWLQRFQVAGDAAGNTLDDITGAVSKMQDRIAGGDASAVGALSKLNLTLAQLRSLKPEDQFVLISERLKDIKDPAQQVNIAMDLFGKSGAEILPTIKAGFDDVKDAAVGMSDETAKALDKMGDNLAAFWRRAKGLAADALVGTANALGGASDPLVAAQLADKPFLEQTIKDARSGAIARLPVQGKLPTNGTLLPGIGNTPDSALQILNLVEAHRPLASITAQINENLERQRKLLAEIAKLSGADLVENITLLSKAWDGLTPAERENEKVVARLFKAYEPLRKELDPSKLPTNIEAVRAKLIEVPSALRDIERGMGDVSAAAKLLPFTRRDIDLAEGYVSALKKVAAIPSSAISGPIPGVALFGANAKGKTGLNKTVKDSLGSLMGGDIKQVFRDLGGFFERGAGQIGKGFLQGIGNSILGGLTSLLSSGVGLLGKGINSLVGKLTDREGRKTNDLRDSFQASFGKNGVGGSLDDLARSFYKVGLNIDDVNRLLHAGTEKELQKVIDTFNKATSTQNTAFGKLNDAVQKYGFTIEELGPAFRAQRLSENAAQLYEDYKLLTASGIDAATVLKHLSGVVIETAEDGSQKVTDWGTGLGALVHNAITTGTAIPEAMRPIVEEMIRLGLVTKDDGTKYETLESTGLSFTGTMTQGFKDVVGAIGELVTALKDGLEIGLSAAELKAKRLREELERLPTYDGDGYFDRKKREAVENRRKTLQGELDALPIPMASGGAGMVTRPTLFLAGEAGPEYVSFTPQAMVSPSDMGRRSSGGGSLSSGGAGGGPLTVQLVVDGHVLTAVVIDDVAKNKRGAGTKLRRVMRGAA